MALLANLLFRRDGERRARWRGRALQLWSRRLLALFGVRLRVEGPPPVPPFFLVSNHLTYLDVLTVGACVPCVFVAKGEIDGWPVFGALCRSVGTVFVDRTVKRDIPRALGELEQAVAERRGIVVFAEGTTGRGAEVLPFRSSFLDLPAKRELPVHWAAISYATPDDDPPAALAVGWWGNMPFGPHMRELLKLDRIDATVVFGERPVVERNRKALAARLHAEVSRAFVPMPQPVSTGDRGAAEA